MIYSSSLCMLMALYDVSLYMFILSSQPPSTTKYSLLRHPALPDGAATGSLMPPPTPTPPSPYHGIQKMPSIPSYPKSVTIAATPMRISSQSTPTPCPNMTRRLKVSSRSTFMTRKKFVTFSVDRDISTFGTNKMSGCEFMLRREI